VADYNEIKERFSWNEAKKFVGEENPLYALTKFEGDAVLQVSKDSRRKISFSELKSKSLKLALYLKEIKRVKKGDIVSVLASKKIEQVIVLLASFAIGAIYQPLFTAFGPKAIEIRTKDVKPKIIFCQDDQKGKIEGCIPFSKLDEMLVYGEYTHHYCHLGFLLYHTIQSQDHN